MATGKSRSDSDLWLIGTCTPHIVGEGKDGTLQFSHYKKQLPTNKDVLKHLFHLKKTNSESRNISLKTHSEIVISDVLNLWELAKIPTVTKNNARVKLENLFNSLRKLEEEKNMTHKKVVDNRAKFEAQLDKLFDIISGKWEQDIL